MTETYNDLFTILDDLKNSMQELQIVERSANDKFIRQLMNELKEAYNLIKELNTIIETSDNKTSLQ